MLARVYSVQGMNDRTDKEERVTLALLEVIGRQSDVSQRHLARHLGVALGLANSYLKHCVRKGLVKVREAPANRYLYYLTPKGFAEKSRLTAQYLSISFEFYRKAGESCLRVFDQCQARGFERLLLCGVSDLAEIAAVRAIERELTVVAVLDAESTASGLLGKPVVRQLAQAPDYDAAVLTALTGAAERYEALLSAIDPQRLLVPDLFGLDTRRA